MPETYAGREVTGPVQRDSPLRHAGCSNHPDTPGSHRAVARPPNFGYGAPSYRLARRSRARPAKIPPPGTRSGSPTPLAPAGGGARAASGLSADY